MIKSATKDRIGKSLFTAAAIVCTISVAAIFAFLLISGFPALKKIGFFNFLFGTKWLPDKNAAYD